MKKISILLVTLLVVGAGCRRQKKVTLDEATAVERPEGQSKSLFVDDVEAFVLEEESDPFSSGEGFNEGVNLVSPEEWDKEKTGQYAFKTIYFDFNQYSLRPDQQGALEVDLSKAADAIKAGHTIVIEGHSCKFAGSPSYNMMLSEERAKVVKNYFVKKGLNAAKIKVVGRGQEMCVIQEGDREEQAPNRRVEIYILK